MPHTVDSFHLQIPRFWLVGQKSGNFEFQWKLDFLPRHSLIEQLTAAIETDADTQVKLSLIWWVLTTQEL